MSAQLLFLIMGRTTACQKCADVHVFGLNTAFFYQMDEYAQDSRPGMKEAGNGMGFLY